MSTCPELDLLSVYLDEELPRQYEQKLEKHLACCEECKKHYETLKTVHNNMREDSQKILFSDTELDESFLRLKTKMNYKSVVKTTSFQIPNLAKWAMPIVTVAALFLLVIFPIKTTKNQPFFNSQQQVFSAINTSNQYNIPSMLKETGVTRDASLFATTPVFTTGERLTTATIDIFRPDLSETIRISINLDGFTYFNSQTPYEDVILPTSFTVDVAK